MKNGMMPLQRPAEFVKGIHIFSIIGDAKRTKTLNTCVSQEAQNTMISA
jgi:hypothetical protein